MHSFNAGPFTSDTKRMPGNEYSICTCSDSFLFPEPVDIAVSVHRTMQECVTAATEQKIPGNCYPVDKVIHQDNNEIPAGL